MELKHLQAFYRTARLNSVTAAAAQLNATQPAISQRIKRLEQDLGISLFGRDRKKLHLTSQGRDLLTYADQMTNLVKEIHLNIGKSQNYVRTLRIGAADMVAQLWLARLTSLLMDDFPGLTLEITTGLTVNLRQQLMDGELDLAILAGPVPNSQFTSFPLGQLGMQWVVGGKHRGSAGHISTRKLANLPILRAYSESQRAGI